jgi:hypothetical protein
MRKLLRKLTNVFKKRARNQKRAAPRLPVVHVSDTLLSETGRLIASFAEGRDSEGVVYWFGIEVGDKAVVTTLVVPDADTTYGCISTTPEANGEALGVIVGTPLVLIGQAHSHPGNGVRHSPFDDRETFARFEGAISIVVPYYARRGVDLRLCGVHRHINGAFQLINKKQLPEHIVIVPGQADLRRHEQRKVS